MPYNPNVPQPNDKLRNSQNDLLINFQAISTGFALNHVDLAIAGAGKHNLLTMPRQAFPQVVAGTDLLMYTGLNADTARSEIYLKRSTDVGDGIPTSAAATDNATFGWSYLPSGVQVKWGTIAFNGAAFMTYTFAGPAFVGINSYSVSVSIDSAATVASVIVHNLNATQFQLFSNVPAANTYRYIAIGS